MTAIKAIKDDSIIVFIDGSNLHLTPKSVVKAIEDAPLVATPIVAVFDSAIEKNLGVLGYGDIRKRDGLKNLKAKIAELRGTDNKVTSSPEAGNKQIAKLTREKTE